MLKPSYLLYIIPDNFVVGWNYAHCSSLVIGYCESEKKAMDIRIPGKKACMKTVSGEQ
jgi:hypothetical protein